MKAHQRLLLLRAAALLTALFLLFSFSACGLFGTGEYETANPEKVASTVLNSLQGHETGGNDVAFLADGSSFYRQSGDKWNSVYLAGVNIGLSVATTSLDNPDVSFATYYEWFTLISEMNANTVKVFTVMNPDFYRAFFAFNKAHADSPLFLFQGIWFNEEYMYTDPADAFGSDGVVVEAFKRGARETVDIIHGKSDYTSYGQWDPAIYDCDLSPYLAGYILGLEWTADFVINTNTQHPDKANFAGNYLSTAEGASPFEAFLCEVGDYLIEYETEGYRAQTPVAFLNWSTTDTLSHSNEPFPDEEDAVSVNTENITSSEKYYAGLFAAIDLYPYYPDFLNYQEEYVSYVDETKKNNPYKAYLTELIEQYTVPVVVAEFGLPTSRGCAHNSVMGFNQGGITEQEQGKYVSSMLLDIVSCGYAGSMIFSWQDEWFKQTWNTVRYYPDDPTRRTPNVQSAEQSYGILAMEPGRVSGFYCDGDFSEWANKQLSVTSEGYSVLTEYDEGYLYLYIKPGENFDFEQTTLLVPISTTGLGSTLCKEYGTTFSQAADFLLVIDGMEQTRLLVDAYRDIFSYNYAFSRGVFEWDTSFSARGAGTFNHVNNFVANELVLPQSGETVAAQYYESGLLKFGINNPKSAEYDSLADFYAKEGGIEVRIPWYILNVLNAADRITYDDFYMLNEVAFTEFEGISLGIAESTAKTITLSPIEYGSFEDVSYTARLKKSYSYLSTALGKLYKK